MVRTLRNGTLRAAFLAALACLLAAPASSLADDARGPAELAAELARLRGEIDRLSDELESTRREGRDALRSLTLRKSELTLDVERERLRVQQLRRAREEQKLRLEQVKASQSALKPVAAKAIDIAAAAVEHGVPFQREARRGEFEALRKRLDEGLIGPVDVLVRLWNLVEDELRLTRENGLYQQVVVLDGDEVLADVARLGTAMMFFETRDGRVGRAVHTGGAGAAGAPSGRAWIWEVRETPDERVRITKLFETLRKRVRVGFFELPAALPPPVASGATR